MGKMTFEPDHEMGAEEPRVLLYEAVAAHAGLHPATARLVLESLRKMGYTIATPRLQWR